MCQETGLHRWALVWTLLTQDTVMCGAEEQVYCLLMCEVLCDLWGARDVGSELTSCSDWLTRANFKVHPVLLQHTEQSEQVWHQIYKVSSWFLLTRVEKNRLPDSRKIFMHIEEQKKTHHLKPVQRVMSGLKGGGWFPRTTKKRMSPNVSDHNDNSAKKKKN